MKEFREKILVVSSTDTVRTPVVKHFLTEYGFSNVKSCGLDNSILEGTGINENMSELLKVSSEHKSQHITKELVDWADVIYCMEVGQIIIVSEAYETDKACLFDFFEVENPLVTGRYKEVLETIEQQCYSLHFSALNR